jgi:HPt (histidine-containing phosphotransfer) domain-containing protein
MKYLNPIGWQPVDGNGYIQSQDELQRKLIYNFAKDNKTKFSEIIQAIDAGDIKLAHRLAHSLKSNAGQLGKTLLQKAAEDVEQHLENGKNRLTEDHLKALETKLDAVLSEFEAILAAQGEPSQPVVQAELFETMELRELLDKLDPMLNEGNPECRQLTGSLRRITGAEELIKQIEDFDFEQAVVTLAELKKKWKVI